ncbi:DegT/DnrJ/EryC1/StrS family aminotransferase [Riemerella anatipestifer]|uniref:DegT/DnrJ/EryC1/StrS family aminotransferase n=1 Tax=Riemerella anatipestifer TaxID=34085 RepID=A0AAP6HHZ7_RIEAN|nr:DegT/DnrJ/EryC1/StrS family aminotransferase [Riemerella anatipestifer]MBT0573048.1 DegT/DnrJ/EryC1/StrS family aminotransferase [Riemerella anatipestifer]MCU7573698.1 DegT/DnrJ/EryC1/StrS family aminotransferase [Riemerella anatipestifer]MCU7594858.1 DegT/DnrJ/EryC1/StrS family aminotransferase [Riemerella anatipestifer]MCW0486129.1 DegT/DnrJ/EryC1/StrS family aminotransferase [Riemerella anatipestifer]MCW0489189.1 DegT/DnrJ/EryC1/StrS family aminotransferase [Riemerella anatipestifer]
MLPLVKTLLPSREVLMPELEKILYSGYIAQGDVVDDFEMAFKRYIGSGYTLSLNSGTAALHIALILAGVKEGDEVISTALTAEPTNVAIKMIGAKIRYADVDLKTGGILPLSIEKNINRKTKAILFVDYAGVPSDVKSIKKISEKYNIPVIEDAAHALGATFEGKKIGCHFPFTVFSFQAIKHLTTIDGGALQIQDKALYKKAKKIRWFGLDKGIPRLKNDITFQGYKYHMNNVNACVGLVQLRNIESIVEKYVRNGEYLDTYLKDIQDIELLEYYPNSKPSYWLYTIKVKRDREALIKKLAENGIMASELHKRSDLHTYLNDFPNTKLSNLDIFYTEMLHLPCGWWVTEEDCEKMVRIIKEGW